MNMDYIILAAWVGFLALGYLWLFLHTRHKIRRHSITRFVIDEPGQAFTSELYEKIKKQSSQKGKRQP